MFSFKKQLKHLKKKYIVTNTMDVDYEIVACSFYVIDGCKNYSDRALFYNETGDSIHYVRDVKLIYCVGAVDE